MNAIEVNNIYKKFGNPNDPFWKRMIQRVRPTNGHNGNGNGNGSMAW